MKNVSFNSGNIRKVAVRPPSMGGSVEEVKV